MGEIVLGVMWAFLVAIAMLLAAKFYVPYLLNRVKVSAAETSISSPSIEEAEAEASEASAVTTKAKSEITFNNFTGKNRLAFHIILVLSALFIGFVGYQVSPIISHEINIAKITLALIVLAIVFVTDIDLMIIPNHLSGVLIIGRVITIILEFIFHADIAMGALINSVITLVLTIAILLILALITRGGIGMGDVKLFGTLGFLLGGRAVVSTIILSLVVGALYSTILLISKKKSLKDVMPLGPFALYGLGITLLLGFI